jgi:hypothetical protein
MPDIIKKLPNDAWRVMRSGWPVFVTCHKGPHHKRGDSRAWIATPLLRTGRGVPLEDLARTASTRRAAIIAAADAYLAARDAA